MLFFFIPRESRNTSQKWAVAAPLPKYVLLPPCPAGSSVYIYIYAWEIFHKTVHIYVCCGPSKGKFRIFLPVVSSLPCVCLCVLCTPRVQYVLNLQVNSTQGKYDSLMIGLIQDCSTKALSDCIVLTIVLRKKNKSVWDNSTRKNEE